MQLDNRNACPFCLVLLPILFDKSNLSSKMKEHLPYKNPRKVLNHIPYLIKTCKENEGDIHSEYFWKGAYAIDIRIKVARETIEKIKKNRYVLK